MTVEDVKGKVNAIRRASGDNEQAHQLEDELNREVLGAVAAGAPNARELAAAALAATKIDFTRWYA